MPTLRLACLALFVAAAIGCQSDRPAPVAPEVAMKHFNDQLANHCPTKHYDPEKFAEFAKDYYIDADTQSQQLIDLDAQKACAGGGQKPECSNTGFITAEIQMAGIDDIVKATCAAK